ncbi:MAG: IS3 family transposase, partial [Clostridiales bacterium]|nr:IS3 family transposase [Clostridiales bacterium]
CECVHLNNFATRSQAQNEIFRYIEAFYNLVRPHSGIGWRAPHDFETSLCLISSESA